ncbi:hypothetical protein [Rhizobium sp. 18055]|uniref:hypothetical protein n=1 Tax=Rhizobium sp. 18055 TaxID=2681403 RepID=UPI00135920F9|nr:hypothetical protein [Rhizobium sp. 18055]
MAKGLVRHFECRLRAKLTKANKINGEDIPVATFIYRLVKNLSNGKFHAEKPDSAAQFFASRQHCPIRRQRHSPLGISCRSDPAGVC